MNKVAIYCRLSDEDRNKTNSFDDSESIQNQKNLLAKYAIEKEWDIFKIYSDDDYSGLDKDRPDFNLMIKDAEAKKFDIVLCKNQKRFTRDMELVEKYLHKEFIEWGIRFVGLTDNADTSIKGNKKQRQINGLVNEWYCEEISEDIKAVFNLKRSEGQFIGSFAAYGYKKDPENKNKLLIDDEASQIIKMIYNWYLEGYGTQHIAYTLNEKEYPNPTKYKQNAGLNFKNSSMNNDYGLWNKTTVKRILKNEMFIGNMVQGKRKKVSYKSKKIISTPKNEWIRAENTHEAIIEKKVFDEVQRRIGERQRSTGEGRSHMFATKIKCADCGSTMTKITSTNGFQYLRCKTYAVAANKNLCSNHSIRLDVLQDVVAKKLELYINDYLDESSIAHRLQSELDVNYKINKCKDETSNIEKQIQQNSQVLKNLYIDKVKGIITDEQFIELSKGFTKEKEVLNTKKEENNNKVTQLSKKTNDINEYIEIVKEYKDFKELTHQIVNEFIDYIEIGEKNKETGEQKIKIHWLI